MTSYLLAPVDNGTITIWDVSLGWNCRLTVRECPVNSLPPPLNHRPYALWRMREARPKTMPHSRVISQCSTTLMNGEVVPWNMHIVFSQLRASVNAPYLWSRSFNFGERERDFRSRWQILVLFWKKSKIVNPSSFVQNILKYKMSPLQLHFQFLFLYSSTSSIL